MITVTISINGSPIFTRSATQELPMQKDGKYPYDIDTGETVLHHPNDGAVALAKMLLDTITEPGSGR